MMTAKIDLPDLTAERLMLIYNEMYIVEEKNKVFDQNNCEICAIGHALKSKIIKKSTNDQASFNHACNWIGFPSHGSYNTLDSNSLVALYLFGGRVQVVMAAKYLSFTFDTCNTPKDFQKRVQLVLEKAGFELSWKKP